MYSWMQIFENFILFYYYLLISMDYEYLLHTSKYYIYETILPKL